MMARWLILGLFMMAAPWVLAQDGRTWTPQPVDLEPFDRFQKSILGIAGREMRVVATGKGNAALGVYVYDSLGHCVAFDDEPFGSIIDDRVAAWVPAANGPFDVQIRSMGPCANRIEVTAKY